MWDSDWRRLSRCRAFAHDDMYVTGKAQHQAVIVCVFCPVRTECLAEALDRHDTWGVWGGMTARQRKALLARRPNVTSWRNLLEAARDRSLTAA